MRHYLLLVTFVATHYGFVSLLGLTSYAIGHRLTRRIKYDSLLEELAICTSLGLGTVASLVLLLGLIGLLYRPVVLLVIVVCMIAAYPAFPHLINELRSRAGNLRAKLLFGGVGFLVAVPVLAMPLYPPTAYDSVMYFLATAKIFARNHQLVLTPYLRLPVLVQLNEMLFTFALLLYDDAAAQLIQLFMLVVLVLAVMAFTRNYFSNAAGWWAAAILLANPMVLFWSVVAYVDISLVLFSTVAAYTFWKWLHSHERHWLSISGAFCAFAASTKYPGLVFPLVLGLVTIWVAIRERRYSSLLWFAGPVLLIAGPWYIRNYYYTRNPVFPFLPRIFGYSFWTSGDVDKFASVMRGIGIGRSLRSIVTLPWHLAFDQQAFYGSPGVTRIYFFALPLLFVFAVKDARVRKLMGLAVVFTAFWFFTDQELRYLMPAIPMMSVATATSLDRFFGAVPFAGRWPRHWIVVATLSGVFAYGGWQYMGHVWRGSGPLPVTEQQRDTYLEQRLPSHPAYKMLNRLRGSDYTVYGLYDVIGPYYADGSFMGDVFGPANHGRITGNLSDGRGLYTELRNLGVDFFLVNKQNWDVKLPDDVFFREHFRPIYSQDSILMFELYGGKIVPPISQDQ